MEDLRNIFNSYKAEMIPARELTINIGGIECYGLFGEIKKISLQDKVIYKGIGEAIFVDKNHDFSYYIEKDALADNNEKDLIRDYNGNYPWGSTKFAGVTSTSIGSGLINTNNLIEASLARKFDLWNINWNLIRKFRKLHSDNWFLPSIEELILIYKIRNNLNNLVFTSSSLIPYYWSSSEHSAGKVWSLYFGDGVCRHTPKYTIGYHLRLCVRY